MATNGTPISNVAAEPLREPPRKSHRCPWWAGRLMASPLRRWLENPDTLLGPFVRPGMAVLDLGSAMGFFSLPVARMVGEHGRVICVDVEPRMIDGLRRRAHRAGLAERIETLVCSEGDLGLAGRVASVDLALAIHVLHEMGDIAGALRQTASVLKRQGRLLVVEPKGHVTTKTFDYELSAAAEAGLSVERRLSLRRRHAALLNKQA
jgi:ubiquinone/menaquinone biosynthesis C-methylase UbiE